jgi:hypothetical protein
MTIETSGIGCHFSARTITLILKSKAATALQIGFVLGGCLSMTVSEDIQFHFQNLKRLNKIAALPRVAEPFNLSLIGARVKQV